MSGFNFMHFDTYLTLLKKNSFMVLKTREKDFFQLSYDDKIKVFHLACHTNDIKIVEFIFNRINYNPNIDDFKKILNQSLLSETQLNVLDWLFEKTENKFQFLHIPIYLFSQKHTQKTLEWVLKNLKPTRTQIKELLYWLCRSQKIQSVLTIIHLLEKQENLFTKNSLFIAFYIFIEAGEFEHALLVFKMILIYKPQYQKDMLDFVLKKQNLAINNKGIIFINPTDKIYQKVNLINKTLLKEKLEKELSHSLNVSRETKI